MEEEWEDFLGLDEEPAPHQSAKKTEQDQEQEQEQVQEERKKEEEQEQEDEDKDFTLDEQLGPLKPSAQDDATRDEDRLDLLDNPHPHSNVCEDPFKVDFLSTEEEEENGEGKEDFISSNETKHEDSSSSNVVTNESSEDDFMSWLDDKKTSPEKEKKKPETSSSDSKAMMDNFFDEVFGDDEKSSLSNKAISSSKSFETQLRKEIASGFCDANKIRTLIFGAGYLPKNFRAQVWSILIDGSCNEDQEAEFWRPNGSEQIANKQELTADCTAAISKAKQTTFCPPDAEQAEVDLSDIILLYCVRRKKAYHRFYSAILGPLLVTPHPTSRALSSSCFYSLCSGFVPLINLSQSSYVMAERKLNEWFRLLLSYHYPLLVLHLDRIYPGWELAMESKSTSEMVTSTTEAMKNASLDEMERDLGLPTGTIGPDDVSTDVLSSQVTQESRKGSTDNWGCIPTLWLLGIFGDSLPPEQACSVLDWAILNQDRYFGMYFTATLFGLYSEALMKLNQGQIRDWMAEVSAGGYGKEWFKLLPLSARPQLSAADESTESPLDWRRFMCGWLHASTAMSQLTPTCFKEALGNTELWASNASFDDISEANTPSVDKRRDMDDSVGKESGRAKVLKMKSAMEQKSRKVLKRFSKKVDAVRKAGLEIDDLDKWEEDSRYDWQQWPHVSKKNFRCIWASAPEVVPSLCSKRNASLPVTSAGACGECKVISGHFCHGCEWVEGNTHLGVERKGGEGMTFPQLKDEQHNTFSVPNFFAVDIRSSDELLLGKFPTAFHLDPNSLSDPDMISSYLSTLEPMSEIAHICIMGVGEEFVQSKVLASASKKRFGDLDTPSSSFALLEEAMSEYHASLTSVVVFFLKKGFRHVSILDGGFMAAARYLLRDDCTGTLGSTLVDVYPPALDKLLGEGTCARNGIKPNAFTPDLLETPAATSNTSNGNMFFSNLSSGANLGSLVSSFTSQMSGGEESAGDRERSTAGSVDMGRRFGAFGSSALSSLRKSVGVVTGSSSPPPAPSAEVSDGRGLPGDFKSETERKMKTVREMQFVIDEDEEEAEEEAAQAKKTQRLVDAIPDTDKVSVSRSEAEKSQALAMHILSGVQKGDEVKIEKASLPGAVLFPALKEKVEKDENGLILLDNRGEPKSKPVHRFLVVTKERFIVLDSKGLGVGAVGLVKSNHHLTELIKITFKKKDPDGVVLFISAPGRDPKPHSYKVAKRNDFIKTLQEKMKRFK